MITVEQLGILHRRVRDLRALCEERGIDIAGIHLIDAVAESRTLASRLGSPWPHLAGDPDFPEDLLAVNGEKADELLPAVANYLANR